MLTTCMVVRVLQLCKKHPEILPLEAEVKVILKLQTLHIMTVLGLLPLNILPYLYYT